METFYSPITESPDPLGLSRTDDHGSSPTKPLRRSTTPKKLTSSIKKNFRLQDFYLKTPPPLATSHISPGRSTARSESVISPWKIRVTVDAEHEDNAQPSLQLETPSRRQPARTTTIQVPLKNGDESPSKRPRGRPRKSTGSPVKRRGTPKPSAARKRRTMAEILQEETEDNRSPGVKDTRKRKAREGSQLMIDDNDKETDEQPIQNKPRPRSRGRRKAITPIKFAVDETTNETHTLKSPIPQNRGPLKATTGNVSPPKSTNPNAGFEIYSDSQGYRLPVSGSKAAVPEAAHSRVDMDEVITTEVSGNESTLEKKDEAMWRSMIRPSFRSPRPAQPDDCAGSPSLKFSEPRQANENGIETSIPPLDPTDEHQEFDSIMESEGFSMISTSSLPSVGQQSQKSVQAPLGNITHHETPVKSPVDQSMPPPPLPPPVDESNRPLSKPTQGTPRILRVVRAGNALNGAIEPSEITTSESPPLPEGSDDAPSRSDDVFGGFGAGTRRELRAGLRLGEELAKRYATTMSEAPGEVMEVSGQEHSTQDLYPTLPRPISKRGSSAGDQQIQLPSPEDSEVLEEEQMSWKATSPPRTPNPENPQTPEPDHSCHSKHYEVDNTIMRAQDKQWQLEREAVSRQIEMANASQVIVIDSDDEGDGEAEEAEEEDDDDFDIWQQEANSSHMSTAQASHSIHNPFSKDVVKPPRGKLPTPWRRNSHLLYSDEITEPTDHQSSLSRQTNDHPGCSATQNSRDSTSRRSPRIKQESVEDTPAFERQTSEEASTEEAPHVPPVDKVDLFPGYGDESRSIPDMLPSPMDKKTNQSRDFIPYPSPDQSSESLAHDSAVCGPAPSTKDSPAMDSSRLVISQTVVERSRKTLFEAPILPIQNEAPQLNSPKQTKSQKRPRDRNSPQQSRKPSQRPRLDKSKPTPAPTAINPLRRAPAPITQTPSIKQPTSLLNQLTSFLPSFTFSLPTPISHPHLHPHPLPLTSIDGGPLPPHPLYSHLPWTPTHFAYLYPYYSLARKSLPSSTVYTFKPKSPTASLLGQTIHNKCGWSKPCEEWEIGVADRFLALLNKYGRRRTDGLDDVKHLRHEEAVVLRREKDGNRIEGRDVVVKLFQLWVGGVVKGECEVGDTGGRTGEVLDGKGVGKGQKWVPGMKCGDQGQRQKVVEWGMVEK